jgi:hypothetical protein
LPRDTILLLLVVFLFVDGKFELRVYDVVIELNIVFGKKYSGTAQMNEFLLVHEIVDKLQCNFVVSITALLY